MENDECRIQNAESRKGSFGGKGAERAMNGFSPFLRRLFGSHHCSSEAPPGRQYLASVILHSSIFTSPVRRDEKSLLRKEPDASLDLP